MAIELYNCDTFKELADTIIKAAKKCGESCDIEVYGHYDEIKSVFEELIRGGAEVGCILELQDYEIANYSREFVLAYIDGVVAVEKDWIQFEDGTGRYCIADPDIAFVFDDCNSKLLKEIYSDHVVETSVGVDYEEDSPWLGTQKVYNKKNQAKSSEADKKPEAEKPTSQKEPDKKAEKKTEDVGKKESKKSDEDEKDLIDEVLEVLRELEDIRFVEPVFHYSDPIWSIFDSYWDF